MRRTLLKAATAVVALLMLSACASKSPKEKMVDALKEAIERVDAATTRKKLDCASKMFTIEYKQIFKDVPQAEQVQVMNCKEVVDLQKVYNKKVMDKRKVVR